MELVRRVKIEEANLKALPAGDANQQTQKSTAIAQTETALTQLQSDRTDWACSHPHSTG